MTREEVKEKVLSIIREQLNPEDSIEEGHSFGGDLNADSLDAAEMVMKIEEEFNLTIPDQEGQTLKTVGLTIDYICQRLKGTS